MPRFMLRDRITREKLEKLYLGQGMSSNEIGRYFDVNGASVVTLLHQYGIPRRAKGGGKHRSERTAKRVKPVCEEQ